MGFMTFFLIPWLWSCERVIYTVFRGRGQLEWDGICMQGWAYSYSKVQWQYLKAEVVVMYRLDLRVELYQFIRLAWQYLHRE